MRSRPRASPPRKAKVNKKPFVLLTVVFLALGPLACGKSWVEFKSPDGLFVVEMPVAPIAKPAPSGTSYRATDGDVMYMVSVSSVPDQFKDPAKTETLFDNLQMSAMGSDKLPADRKRITLGKEQYLGREILVERSTAGGSAMRGRAYRAHNTLFFLTVLAPREKLQTPDVERFFASLTVLKTTAS
jgi:hypothetical protein